jgi:hypothetical protein
MGRRYFSNAAYFEFLESAGIDRYETSIMGSVSSEIFRLDAATLAGVRAIAGR